MSYLVLARKYRPQSFEQVIKQEHVTRTLVNAISSSRVAHGILFAGPRGTGKTTVARILAKAMNCEKGPTPTPCNQCRSCLEITRGNAVDVIEIDGASNNGVENVRELREHAKYMPAHSPYKIYIIDEVHMLSQAAFNALLKILEEPPSHIMFVFATTEPHKIPITILSRCQRHDFKRISSGAISDHMAFLCAQEAIDIPEESLRLIAKEAGGSMRDALSLLDQVMACSDGSTISNDQVADILGVLDRKTLFEISAAIFSGDVSRLLALVDDIYRHGHNIREIYSAIISHFRDLLVIRMGKQVDRLVDVPAHEINAMIDQVSDVSELFLSQVLDLLFKRESTIKFSTQPKIALEMTLIEMHQIRPALPIDVLIEKLDVLSTAVQHGQILYQEPADSMGSPAPAVREIVIPEEPVNIRKPAAETEKTVQDQNADMMPVTDPEKIWQKIVAVAQESRPSLGAVLSQASLKNLSDRQIEIDIGSNRYHYDAIHHKKNMQVLKTICHDILGAPVDIVAAVPEKTEKKERGVGRRKKEKNRKDVLNNPLISDALEIFGGKVVNVRILS